LTLERHGMITRAFQAGDDSGQSDLYIFAMPRSTDYDWSLNGRTGKK
jgi:hypothetical protein